MRRKEFPPGWDEKRVQRVLEHYDLQTEEEAVAEDEAAYDQEGQVFIEIPRKLLREVRNLIAKHETAPETK